MKFEGAEISLPVSFGLDTDQVAGLALSQRRFATSVRAIRWRWRFALQPLQPGLVLAAVAAHRARHGVVRPFDFPVLQIVEAKNVPAAGAVGVAGAEVVRLAVAPGSRTVIPEGLFVAFGTARKVYQVGAPLDSTSTGPELQIRPPLVEDVHDALDVAPIARVRYAESGGARIRIGPRGVAEGIVISLVEAL